MNICKNVFNYMLDDDSPNWALRVVIFTNHYQSSRPITNNGRVQLMSTREITQTFLALSIATKHEYRQATNTLRHTQ